MRVASEIILALSLEQAVSGPPWPHPWDHYPFVNNGQCVWLRYRDLDTEQRKAISDAVARVKRRLSTLDVQPRRA
ncbi:MAG: hypothetical protein PVI91_01210 [Gammaproteobacteria bacterium]|jgi:hypothetical protein